MLEHLTVVLAQSLLDVQLDDILIGLYIVVIFSEDVGRYNLQEPAVSEALLD